jgi:hypothetical protein
MGFDNVFDVRRIASTHANRDWQFGSMKRFQNKFISRQTSFTRKP